MITYHICTLPQHANCQNQEHHQCCEHGCPSENRICGCNNNTSYVPCGRSDECATCDICATVYNDRYRANHHRETAHPTIQTHACVSNCGGRPTCCKLMHRNTQYTYDLCALSGTTQYAPVTQLYNTDTERRYARNTHVTHVRIP